MNSTLKSWLASPWLLTLLPLLAFIWQANALPLFDLDEGAFSEATREMLASGNYLATYLDGEPRYDKPILIYWLQALSVNLLGLNEFALRLPSILAALGWMLVIYRFVRQRCEEETATAAAAFMALSLTVGVIAKAAIADALLNLILAAILFDIYRFFETPAKPLAYRIYLLMGLGFLTKGPVAVVLPFMISALFFGSYGRWRDWAKAIFFLPGWLLFLVVALPWYIAVYFEQGWAFFEGFFLGHNLGRLSGTMEGHGGHWAYYLLVLPFVLMPFAGLLLCQLPNFAQSWQDPLQRFLWIWFLPVLLLFSFSNTQLPHYILYGCTPLFLLMALGRERLQNPWLAYLPPLLLFGFLLAFPELLALAEPKIRGAYDQALVATGREAMGWVYRALMALGLLSALGLFFIGRRWLLPWQGLVLLGIVQAVAVNGTLLPVISAAQQQPVKVAALLARSQPADVVAYQTRMPSFSLYRRAITPHRDPKPGDLVFTRKGRLTSLEKELGRQDLNIVFQQGGVLLVKVPKDGD